MPKPALEPSRHVRELTLPKMCLVQDGRRAHELDRTSVDGTVKTASLPSLRPSKTRMAEVCSVESLGSSCMCVDIAFLEVYA